ncbi:MAG TPA: ATP-binding cassette domain-containing protein [bacterium]|nr:ATP-binding cassette domain-containing protein [bacterium]
MSIRLIELTKRFDGHVVVDRVSLEIEEGELFTLLGGSGSGKSTILRLIAGLLLADGGRIELNGRDVTETPPQERGTGFVFQNYSIFRHMTVADNVEFGLRIRRVAAAERRQRREELLDLVGLTGLGDRYADQLSGGQQQRVALARALAYRPEVLLLDEPFGALDVKIRGQLRRSLKEIQRHLKVTTILVTHDQEEAFELADRVGVIERGHLMEVGTPEDLYHRPQTEFVATFIGGGNVLVGREEEGRIRLGSVLLPMPEKAGEHEAGAPVRVLFRPEKVLLAEGRSSERPGAYTLGRGRLVSQIFAGALSRVALDVQGLEGARPISPSPGYGQRTTRIEALLPSEASTPPLKSGREFWIGLDSYHVLSPSGLKVLVCVDEAPAPQPAVEFGALLARTTGGSTTLLTVVPADAADGVAAGTRDALESLRGAWSGQAPRLDSRVRSGDNTTEILLEAQEGLYEVVVIGQGGRREEEQMTGLGTTARRVLMEAGVPVLVLEESRPQIDRVLICTAAGEPGKTDIRFGGRLARRTGAETTVLHVRPGESTPAGRRRAERHLEQAGAFLGSLGVRSEIKLADGPLVETILAEAKRGDYDLIVIGAPAPRAVQRLRWRDFATSIVSGTERPVLVVPMRE